MAKRIYIDNDLLALFLSGKTTLEETFAILKAAKTNPDIAFVLDIAIGAGMLEQGAGRNESIRPVSMQYKLKTKHLPIMRLAANSDANDCVVKCEAYMLKKHGKEKEYDGLLKKAKTKRWLQKEGTPLHHIGRLAELAKLSVSRQFGGTIEKLSQEINADCSVIVALHAEQLSESRSLRTAVCNHAVVVLNVDMQEGTVEIYDPQSKNPTDSYSVDIFLKAWKPSKNFFVSVIERGIRPYIPHPEYVAHIQLPDSLAPLTEMLAENAHDIWAKDRLAEAEKAKGKKKAINPYDDPFMKPFAELANKDRKTDYTSALHTIKLLYKLGFVVKKNDYVDWHYQSSGRNAEGVYVPQPIDVSDVVLPREIKELTEYIAENTHEEWARVRIKAGWAYAPKNNKRMKLNKNLIPYCELLDCEKEYDRKMAMHTLRVLYKLGYSIERG